MKKIIIVLIILLSAIQNKNLIAQDIVIDKVIAVVGAQIILYSDIETQYQQLKMQGYSPSKTLRCEILEELLFQKLMLNQAEVDSVEITDEQVESEMDRRLRYFISQIGSEQKLEEYYDKTIVEIKAEMRELIRDQIMVEKIQATITDGIKVTPTEVKNFFNKIPKDSLPMISSEMEIAQIVNQPIISQEEKLALKDKLNKLRERILKGEKFSVLARLYSEDPGSASKGGEVGMFGRGAMQPEFEAAAFNLKTIDEVSPIIETKFGYHILQLIERRGDYINVKHILLQPKASPMALLKSKNFLDSISALIYNNTYTFEEAVAKFSTDPGRNNGGLLMNPMTGTATHSPDELEPNVFFTVDKLKVGEMSKPVIMKTEDGLQAYRILSLKSRTKPHIANLKDDYNKIQEEALNQKKNEAIQKWISKKALDTYVEITDENYQKCEFKYNWVKVSE
ncbi:MAG: peptidylprolyl isomerase [Saprospiraceae bacterium]|nr:peptidylprolyl isomerase [Saprospiraceae bacterium]